MIELETTKLPNKGNKINPRPHLPDCPSLQPIAKDCDCGRPYHPLSTQRELYRDNDGRIRTRKKKGSK